MKYVLILTIHADPAMPPGYGEWGGTHTYMKELLDSLNELKIKCILITRRSMEELPKVEQYHQYCTIYRLQNGDLSPIDKTKLQEYHQQNLKEIQQIINNCGEKPEIIHSVYWNSGRLGIELSKIYDVPLVHSVISNSRGRQSRGASEPVFERAAYEQDIYDYAKWILCVSEDEKNDLMRFYNINQEKIIVAGQYIHPSFIMPSRDQNGFPKLNSNISASVQERASLKYNNIDNSLVQESFWAYKAFTYFGRIDESKGVDHILAAWHFLFKKYTTTCPPLWLIGGSIVEINTMRIKCYKKYPDLALAEQGGKIVWWGCIDSVGASTILLKTLVLVTNSLYEPGGRVITEAMSEGIPVIAAPNGFALDLIHNWENGFLVEHGDEDELALRMEHFIRQPFLASALGENARQTAANVVNNWDFVGNHLVAYGLQREKNISKNISIKNFFRQRRINLFPYRIIPLSRELLCNFVEKSTGEQVTNIENDTCTSGTSNVYFVQTKENNYIIKQPYTRLAISTLVLPVQKEQYLRNEDEFYRYEVLSYEAAKSNILIAKDDFHHLLLLEKLNSINISVDKYPEIISFISSQYIPISQNDSKKYTEILHSHKLESLKDLESLLECLNQNFPNFYFEPSGIFLPYFGWKLSTHILNYNKERFTYDELSFLRDICRSFLLKIELPASSQLVEITGDICLDHVLSRHDKWYLIDRERRTIGMVEYMIADILFDIILRKGNIISEEELILCKQYLSKQYSYKQMILSLSYKIFYKCIIEKVMYNRLPSYFFEMLAVLVETIDSL